MRSVRRRRIRFSPILIISLIAVAITTLLSSSELWGLLVFVFGICLTLAIVAPDVIESRVNDNIKKSKKAGRASKDELKVLNWPKDSLRQAPWLWGSASIFVLIQIAIEPIARYLPLASTYDILGYVDLTLVGIAIVQTLLTIRFIFNPDSRPRINLSWILLGLAVGIIDTMTVFFLVLLYPTFETIPLVGRVFTLLLVPSIPSSILYLWAKWTEKSPLLRKVAYVLVLTPYLFLIALFLIVYTFWMIFGF
jgi:hypothetical protein